MAAHLKKVDEKETSFKLAFEENDPKFQQTRKAYLDHARNSYPNAKDEDFKLVFIFCLPWEFSTDIVIPRGAARADLIELLITRIRDSGKAPRAATITDLRLSSGLTSPPLALADLFGEIPDGALVNIREVYRPESGWSQLVKGYKIEA